MTDLSVQPIVVEGGPSAPPAQPTPDVAQTLAPVAGAGGVVTRHIQDVTMRAAGILIVADDKVLLLQRGPMGDFAGNWAFPGGKIEGDETAIEAAVRETEEETGLRLDPEKIVEHCRTIRDGVEFTTYLARLALDEKAPGLPTPQLCDESIDFMWAPPDALPVMLHPGARVALDRLTWDELGIANAIRDGVICSPVKYMNVWLFELRITGTGAAYRSSKDEFAWRDPALYLNEEFVQRCNGLAVLWEHTEKPMLSTAEYKERNIGSIFLPYIKGNEVWGVAKVYDEPAAQMMLNMQLSTSPGVILKGPGPGTYEVMTDGTKVLVENPPALLDHLAICEVGVWDKAETPQGVNITGDQLVAEDTEERKDDESKIDKLLSHMDGLKSHMDSKLDAMGARLDSIEKGRKDEGEKEDGEAERLAADKAKKDADEKAEAEAKAEKDRKDAEEKEKSELSEKDRRDADEKAESERRDAEMKALKDSNAAMKAKLDEIDTKVTGRTDDDERAMTDAQSRCDSVASAFNQRAPRFLPGESLTSYRRRLAEPYKGYSTEWKDVDLSVLSGPAFDIAERQIFDAAHREARNPSRGSADRLEAVTSHMGGHQITEYRGSPRAWMDDLAGATRQHVTSINSKA